MATISTLRALPRYAVTAWRVGTTDKSAPRGKAHSIDLGDYAADPEAAIEVAAMHCQHKDVLHVLVRDTFTKAAVLHVYAIRAKQDWRKCPDTGVTKRVAIQYPERLYSVDVEAFAPVEPFQWTPGADAVGAPAREIVQ